MFDHLQIPRGRERVLVGTADLALAPLRLFRRRAATGTVTRVLLLRLERIGDLLMVLDAIAAARAAWPDAEIDLAVGSWNAPLARLIPGLARLEVADVPWLAREGTGERWTTLRAKARSWRARGYDLVINFEPDIRSNYLSWLTGAARRFGYFTGGGGAFLTDAAAYDPRQHVAVNARAIVARAAGATAGDGSVRHGAHTMLQPPAEALARAHALLGHAPRPHVGVHVSGGRQSKQWHLERFAAVARDLARGRGATIVLTGSAGDRPMVDEVARALEGVRVIDAAGDVDLPTLAAVLADLDLLVTSDTGPMHLAGAMHTPIVALFGPSHPERYGPLAMQHRVIRVDLPCSPCGQVRLPPARCRGHVPDCMDGITVDAVVRAAHDLLDANAQPPRQVQI
ncbi:MAG TPA: glycosyltransferase family 9 protein [Vicinamibacterales bacterium]|nr:glycosyltransferase family 9 protein [Vicinamibacterales bacterium]